MICRYIKLKSSVSYKRFCRENTKEERLGIMIGHMAILGIVMFCAYLVFHFFMKDNLNIIHKGMFSVFVLISFFSALDLYNEIYKKLYENKERELLLLLPMKKISIVCIFFIELLQQYLFQFFMIFIPVIMANCLIEERFVIKAFFIIMGTVAVGVCMVSIILCSYLAIANFTKGKNVKNVSIVITILATTASYFFAFFMSNFSDTLVGTNYNIVKIIFFPFIKIADIILGNTHGNYLISMLGCYVFALIILFICIAYIRYSISRGLLYYGTIQNGQRTGFIAILQILSEKFLKKQKQQIQVLIQKDIIELFSNWNILKVVLQIFVISLLLTLKIKFVPDGIGNAIVMFGKTIFLVYIISNYLYENETRHIELWLLLPIKNGDWIKEKIYIQNMLMMIPDLLIDVILILINRNSLYNGLILLILDIGMIMYSGAASCKNNFMYGDGNKCEIAAIAKIKNIVMLMGRVLGNCVIYYVIKEACMQKNNVASGIMGIAICFVLFVIENWWVVKFKTEEIERKRIYIEETGVKK